MIEPSEIYKTRFYSDCIGVFQGGGCRAAAYAGAYEAAFKSGVRFSQVAGTSAGAIAAALLAAGAEPDFLQRKLSSLDFSALLEKPTHSTFSRVKKQMSVLRLMPFKGKTLHSAVKVACMGGLYSSAGIEKWVERCLKELTGKQGSPVLFNELVMPLHVVAGDLNTMKARVWSHLATPSQSVAHAVRASCTIPLLFQPVEEGSALLVDGGLVSNIPHFIFGGELRRLSTRRNRILLFMLEAGEERRRAEDAEELLAQLTSLAIDGGTECQLAFDPDIARIVIPTGRIRATDFMEMDQAKVSALIDSGRNAASTFIEGELLRTHASTAAALPISDEHEAYLTICEQLYATASSVSIAMPDTKWFWELFPSVLHWRTTGVRMIVLAPPVTAFMPDAAKERQRRSLMDGMGIELIESESLPFHGLLFDAASARGAVALTIPAERSDYEPAGRFYSGTIDQAVIAALHQRLQLPQEPPDSSKYTPKLTRTDEAELLRLLKTNIQIYRQPDVTLAIEEVEVSQVLLISRYVRAFRYKQIPSLVSNFNQAGIELFAPARVSLREGKYSIVTPPVVEMTGTQYVALEGNTRLLHCFNTGVHKVLAVVVRGVNAPLPGKPVSLKQVRITTVKRPPGERILGHNYGLFREIERAVRPLAEE